MTSGFIASCARLSILFRTNQSTFASSKPLFSAFTQILNSPSNTPCWRPSRRLHSLDDLDDQRGRQLHNSRLPPDPPPALTPDSSFIVLYAQQTPHLCTKSVTNTRITRARPPFRKRKISAEGLFNMDHASLETWWVLDGYGGFAIQQWWLTTRWRKGV